MPIADLKHNKIFMADCQCLLAAFLFGIGFLGQREISVDGLGPMTCNAFRFGVSTILMLLALPLFPGDGPSEKTSDGDKEEHSDDEELGSHAIDKHEDHIHSNTVTPTPTKENHSKSTDSRFILNRICGLNFLSLKFAKKSVWFWGLSLGLLNFLGSGFQQWGITLTTASKVAFIAGFDLFLTPIFGLFIPTFKLNADPQLSTWLAVFASLVGLFLLSGASLHDFEMGMGETLTLISTVFWTLHITYTDISTSYVDTMAMMCIQMGCVTFLSAVTAIWVEPHQWFWSHMYAYWHWIFFLAIVDGLGFLLMAQGQIYAPPTHAAIILSLEGVFASVASFLFIGETLSHREVLGCVIMLAATLVAEIGVPCIDRIWTDGDRTSYSLTASSLELAASKSTSPSKLSMGVNDSKYGSKGASFLPTQVSSAIKVAFNFYSGVRSLIGLLAVSIRNRFIKVKTSDDLYPTNTLPVTKEDTITNSNIDNNQS